VAVLDNLAFAKVVDSRFGSLKESAAPPSKKLVAELGSLCGRELAIHSFEERLLHYTLGV